MGRGSSDGELHRDQMGAGGGPAEEPDHGLGPAQRIPPAPRLLSHRAAPSPLPRPLQETEEIASLHVGFARLVSGAQGDGPDVAAAQWPGNPAGVRAKVRARVAAVARADAAADREFMGSLVRAVAALAERVDAVTARVGELEQLVQDVVDKLSEDLVRMHAALGTLDDLGEPPEHPT